LAGTLGKYVRCEELHREIEFGRMDAGLVRAMPERISWRLKFLFASSAKTFRARKTAERNKQSRAVAIGQRGFMRNCS
jgi:hypothetical protein